MMVGQQAENTSQAQMVEQIRRLKLERRAVVLAHLYQRPEVQDVADYVGDSLGLSQQAAKSDAEAILFCGVHFMAESAAILSPDKLVVLPEPNAGCSMAEMVDAEDLRVRKQELGGIPVVCYVNSSAAVKAESDICCTSRNAVEIVESLPGCRVLFVPDRNLGHWVGTQTSKEVITWDGFCNTHDSITQAEVDRMRELHPAALVMVHPECRPEVTARADRVLSTSGMLRFATESPATEFIVGTEQGILHQLTKQNPTKHFYLPSATKQYCANMKKVTLPKLVWAMEHLEPRVTVPKTSASVRCVPWSGCWRSPAVAPSWLEQRGDGLVDTIGNPERGRTITADFLVVGSGIAGLYAAIKLCGAGRVAVLTKRLREEGNTQYAQGGIAAALGVHDSPELHFQDTLAAGAGLCAAPAVRVMVESGPSYVMDLIRLGAKFDEHDGQLTMAREGAHSLGRILRAGGDATGHEIESALVRRARALGITIQEGTSALRLVLEQGRCTGVDALSDDGPIAFRARATILATGGAGQVFSHTSNPSVSTGDGMAIAWQAGAELMDMEFFQFHPTALAIPGNPRLLITEAVRGEGALLLNEAGRRFMPAYHEQAELAPRDVVARAILREAWQAGQDHVWLDARSLKGGTLRASERFPTVYRGILEHGLDMERELIPVSPVAHYAMGGFGPDPGAGPACPASGRAAKPPASAPMAPTVWPAIPCLNRWSSLVDRPKLRGSGTVAHGRPGCCRLERLPGSVLICRQLLAPTRRLTVPLCQRMTPRRLRRSGSGT